MLAVQSIHRASTSIGTLDLLRLVHLIVHYLSLHSLSALWMLLIRQFKLPPVATYCEGKRTNSHNDTIHIEKGMPVHGRESSQFFLVFFFSYKHVCESPYVCFLGCLSVYLMRNKT